MKKLIIITGISLILLQLSTAGRADVLSAEKSRPDTMGWMHGFPPPDDRTIRFTDPDFFAFPKLRWTVCHFRQLMPTAGVKNQPGVLQTLPVDLDPAIDAVSFTPLDGKESMSWRTAFDVNYTDGLLVLHHGRIVYERYDGCLDSDTLHAVMSVTKSITGLIGEILVARGDLDEAATIGELIPELVDSGFGDATLGQVLEMTTSLDYSEDYADPEADIWKFARAGSPLPFPKDYEGPRSYFDFLETVKKTGGHGDEFTYRTINSDVLGWIIARTTGKSIADWLSENIWSHIGAQREAFYTVDSIGTPFAGGGFNASLRDMGRFGLLVLNNGRINDKQIIPSAAIERIRKGGSKQAFATAGYATLEGWSYRGMWWISHDDHGAFTARGVHGQTIWVDPLADMVIVRFASNPVAANSAIDPVSLPAYRAVADYLMSQESNPQLAGRAWVVEVIGGQTVSDRSSASLLFLPDGRLSGNSSCNRIIGTYSLSAGSLNLQLGGATRMLCSKALMKQESSLLKLLSEVERVDIDKSGTLILKTSAGKTVLARRR